MVLLTGFEPALYSLSNCCVYQIAPQEHIWHPVMDSNHRMSESKSDALDQLGEQGINFGAAGRIRTSISSLTWNKKYAERNLNRLTLL